MKNPIEYGYINLKLEKSDRDAFKKALKTNHNKSMQEMLEMLVKAYIESPGSFKIKIGVVIDGKHK